jgi:hypothetical protein
MLSRSLGIIIASWLPCLALMLPLSPFHTANALAAGVAATVLAALSLADDRARVGAAVIGAWVAFAPFVFRSSLTEIVLSVCWGVTMFVTLGGPLSQEAVVTRVRALPIVREEEEKKEKIDGQGFQVAA